MARTGELVRSGVSLPRSLNVRDTATLTLVDAGGIAVPAEFETRARWNAGRGDTTAPIQWLLVTFRATVAANGSAAYRVITDGSAGSNPAPAVTVKLTQAGDRVTVDTGAATFVFGGSPSALFEEVRLSGGARLVRGCALTAEANGVETAHSTTRSVKVEHAGTLAAIVAVKGTYDMASVGGGGPASYRRYVFAAGSPTAVVRHAVQGEGSRCGNGVVECGGAPNAVRLRRVRDALADSPNKG